MKFDQHIAKKVAPAAAAAAVLATIGGCATESDSTYSPELGPATSSAMESAPVTAPDPMAPGPTKDMDCFLTTACVRAMGLPDDCHELTILRRFRDQHLMATAAGRAEVLRYYRMAPQIIRAIHRGSAPDDEHAAIYRTLVLPSVKLIEAGRFEEAFVHYQKSVLALAQRFGLDIA